MHWSYHCFNEFSSKLFYKFNNLIHQLHIPECLYVKFAKVMFVLHLISLGLFHEIPSEVEL